MRVCASVVSARAAAGTGAGGKGGGKGGGSSGARGKGNKTKRSSSSSTGANSKAATKSKGSGKAAGSSGKASSGSASQQQKQQQQQRQQVAIDPPVNRTIREGKFDALVFDDSSKGTDVFAMDAPHVPPAATTVDDRLAYERKGHVCIRDVLTDDEARNMSIELVKVILFLLTLVPVRAIRLTSCFVQRKPNTERCWRISTGYPCCAHQAPWTWTRSRQSPRPWTPSRDTPRKKSGFYRRLTYTETEPATERCVYSF